MISLLKSSIQEPWPAAARNPARLAQPWANWAGWLSRPAVQPTATEAARGLCNWPDEPGQARMSKEKKIINKR